jgi:hypothetical protein
MLSSARFLATQSVLPSSFVEALMTVRPFVVVVVALVGIPFTSDAQTQLQDKFFDSNGVSIRYVEAGSRQARVNPSC